MSGVNKAVSYLFQIGLFTAALFYLNWQLALVSVVAAPGFLLAARYFSAHQMSAREQRRWTGSVTAVAEESLSNLALIQAYDRRADETARFRGENLGAFTAQLRATRLVGLFGALRSFWRPRRRPGGGVGRVGARPGSDLPGRAPGVRDLPVAALQPGHRARRPVERATRRSPVLSGFSNSWPSGRRWPSLHTRRRSGRPRGDWSLQQLDPVQLSRGGRPALSEVDVRDGPGRAGGGGRGERCRQVDLAKLLLRFYDPDRGRISLDGPICAMSFSRPAPERRRRAAGDPRLRRHGPRQHPLGRPDATEHEIERPPGRPTSTDSSQDLPEGYGTGSASAAACCPAANGSDWRLPAR